MKKIKQNAKIRIVSGDISFYTTAKQIRENVGSSSYFNEACLSALKALEKTQVKKEQNPIGILGNWINYQIQLDLV